MSQVAEHSLHIPHSVHDGNITVVVVVVVVVEVVVVEVVVVSAVDKIVVVVELVVVVVVVVVVGLGVVGHGVSPQISVSIASAEGQAPFAASTIPLTQIRSRLRTPAPPLAEQVCEHCDHCAQLSQIGQTGEQSSCSNDVPGHVSDALPSSNPA